MTVAYDAFTALAIGTGDRSFNHTPAGTPAGAYVFVIVGTNADPATDIVTGVTYGGSAMSQDAASPVVKTSTERMQVHLFKLESSVPTGTQSVAVDVTTADSYLAGVITVTAGANVETIDSDGTISSDSVANPSVTLSLASRTCLCFIGFASGQNAPTGITPLTGWTSRLEDDFGGQTAGIYTYDTIGTTDVTAGWTQTAEDAAMIAIAISEVAAAGGNVNLLAGKFGMKLVGKL